MTSRLHGQEYIQSRQKRRLDVVGALALSGVSAPVILAATATSVIDTRSLHPIFKQPRRGQHGEEIGVYKIRTLRESRVAQSTETFGAHDPRATKVGMLLRHSGVDEAPQLANVIAGDLSLVGVRPYIDSDLERMEAADPALFQDWYGEAVDSKPGIFGVSQLFRRQFLTASTKSISILSMRQDIAYLTEDASLAYDLQIIGRTPVELVLGAGKPPIMPED